MRTMKHETCSTLTLAKESDGLFDLPSMDGEQVVPAERKAPSFAEQISHARMLLKWRKGVPSDHPPRQTRRFVL